MGWRDNGKIRHVRLSAQAKILLLAEQFFSALYKGILVISPHHRHGNRTDGISKVFLDGNWIKGCLVIFISYLSLAAFFFLQAGTVKRYPAPITLTSLTDLAGTLLAAITTAILDHKPSSWRLSWDITLLAPLYSEILVFEITLYAQTLVIREKGPVFMTESTPLSTVIAAVAGLLILGEELHLGVMLRSILMVLSLFVILWAKEYENHGKNLEIVESDNEITLEK